MDKIDISLKDKKELIRLCKIYEYIFNLEERDNPSSDRQWTLDDLSDMAEDGHQVVSIIKKYIYGG